MGGQLLENGDELALPWDDLADGRAWPLLRGRDFFINPREIEEAAQNAATRIGKAVQTMRSQRASTLYIWVQFADYRIEPGAPCPCGSDDLRRINDAWAICASCESTLLVDTRPKGSGGSDAIVVDASQAGDDSDADARLRIFMPEGGRIGDERKRLAALRGASGDAAPKPKPAAERKEAQVREREEKKAQALDRQEAQAREREEKKAQVRQARDDTRRQRQEARNRSREQQRQRREAERDTRGSGPKERTPGTKPPTPPRPQQSSGLTLDRFTNVRLWTSESPQPGRFWGYGYDRKGRFVLLEVTLQLTRDGEPIEDPAQPGHVLHAVNAVRSAPFAAAVDADALLARTDGMAPEKLLSLAPR
jgi:hypothetical protein